LGSLGGVCVPLCDCVEGEGGTQCVFALSIGKVGMLNQRDCAGTSFREGDEFDTRCWRVSRKTWGDGSQMMVVWEEISGRLIAAQDRGYISYEFHGQAEKRDCLSGKFLL
jgi:hypothetical protein